MLGAGLTGTRFLSRLSVPLFLLSLLLSCLASAADDTILDSYSSWRIHSSLAPPVVHTDKGPQQYLKGVRWLDESTASAPANWTTVEFDDRHWVRGAIQRVCSTPYLRQACLRGKFQVADPRRIQRITVSLDFHGGAIIYMNGKEVAREDLPQGKISESTLAAPYPLETFVKANGDLLALQNTYLTKGRAGKPSEDDVRRMQMRTRQITRLEIPGNTLRKGLNVLAVELIRAPYDEVMLEEENTGKERGNKYDWNTCEVQRIEVTADGSGDIVSSHVRPKGLMVWNSDVVEGNTSLDRGDPCESLRPVRIVAASNGRFSGKVVLGSDGSLSGMESTVSDLSGPAGRIPAAAVAVRYAVPWGAQYGLTQGGIPFRGRPALLGMLVDQPPSETVSADGSAVVPVWLTVNVPGDAAPGLYSGTLAVRSRGTKEVNIPLELEVIDWSLPNPQDYRTWVELTEVPDTLAVEYDVPLWSDRHFEMIARSFRLISHTGTRVVYVPLIAHTNLGNEESMVRWIKRGAGRYEYDFSIMDRYLDLAQEHLGTPKIVVLQAWEVYMASANQKRFEDFKRTGGPIVTTLDPVGGKTENVGLPELSDKESTALWKTCFQEVLSRLEKRGLRRAAMIGMFPDMGPSMDDARFFKSVVPELSWVQQGHGIWKDLHGIGEVGYNASVWGGYRFADGGRQTNQKGDPVVESLHGWNRPKLDVVFERNGGLPEFPMSRWRFFAETGITSELRGIGRIGADYWRAVKDQRGRRRGYMHDRFSEGSWAGSGMNLVLCNPVLAPGADGPEATPRLVALAEGIQECEARIAIEKALIDDKLRNRLGPQLTSRCEAALDDRLVDMWRSLSNYKLGGTEFFGIMAWRWTPGIAGQNYLLESRVQERSRELFSLAGEVEAKLGLRKIRPRGVSQSTASSTATGQETEEATNERKAAALFVTAKQMWQEKRALENVVSALQRVIAEYPGTRAAQESEKVLERVNKMEGAQNQ